MKTQRSPHGRIGSRSAIQTGLRQDRKSLSFEGDYHHRRLKHLQIELEQIPLTTEEFQLAINRLNNARAYVKRAEPCAARYEAKLLLGLVRRYQTAFGSRVQPRLATRRP